VVVDSQFPVVTGASSWKTWLKLQAALSATALVVVLVRTTQIARLTGQPNTLETWGPILATQAAFWITWSLWAGVLVTLVRRLVERPPSRAAGIGALAALAVLPPIFLPLVYAPVHWLTFQGEASLHQAYGHMTSHDLLTNILLSATIVGVVYGYSSRDRNRRLAVEASQLSEQLTRAQLDTLRAQLNPHFLFNALNSVAVLARRGNTGEVERMVTHLADLLRHSLESSREQLVALRVELDAVRHYLDIERVRYGERLVSSIDIPNALLDRTVPSFLLQPLVENAIRHGFTDAQHVLRVSVRAELHDGALEISVSDDGAGIAQRESIGNGVGLGNTRSRLEGLYRGRASIALTAGERGTGTTVRVTLPA
jgi:two-component system, LytTR family, sensor kinase